MKLTWRRAPAPPEDLRLVVPAAVPESFDVAVSRPGVYRVTIRPRGTGPRFTIEPLWTVPRRPPALPR